MSETHWLEIVWLCLKERQTNVSHCVRVESISLDPRETQEIRASEKVLKVDPCLVRKDNSTRAFKTSRCLIVHVVMTEFVSVCSVHFKENDMDVKLDSFLLL